ncbi:MAG: hypothetical protein ACRDK3_00100 [Actinomycetota bacterium]
MPAAPARRSLTRALRIELNLEADELANQGIDEARSAKFMSLRAASDG